MKKIMKNKFLATLVILPVITFAIASFSDESPVQRYFKYGGLSTILVREGIRESRKVDRALFLEAQDAIITPNGNIYVKTYGRLASESTDKIYVIELPVAKHKKAVRKLHDKNKLVGMAAFALKKKHLHVGNAFWEEISQTEAERISIVQISDGKELMPNKKQLYFLPKSTFLYGEESPIYGETGHWIRFYSSQTRYTKSWTKVFIPVTYVVDVITSPIQLSVGWLINKNT